MDNVKQPLKFSSLAIWPLLYRPRRPFAESISKGREQGNFLRTYLINRFALNFILLYIEDRFRPLKI
ncbi:hypothetical protein A2833_00625 [Candidatus Azambacteria bacterium RIFCSPHIGHO2_01_FULL_44_55]|nr:MAG: hypothetical protein A2833_00625 [Candidatus Azambacteria bacterium RIFCSPHIGHO2_01_FULL_44_55]OGD50508.1 MAG: hypothetical protein A2608_02040 [Candidatus Azambacteria bacterium RIFOXYD1_FULL_44_10]